MSELGKSIPSAGDVEYANADAICGYQLLLCKIFEREGGFKLPALQSDAIREVKRQGEVWLHQVRTLMDRMFAASQSTTPVTLSAIPELLNSYDIIHRICKGIPCHDYLRKIKLNTAQRWLKGDRTITHTDVVLLLLSEADRDMYALESRFYNYAIDEMGGWIDELSKNGRFINTPLPEAYKRLAYLFGQDLFVYISSPDQSKIKAQWAKGYELTDAQLDQLDTKDLRSYLAFANTASNLSRQSLEERIMRHIHLITKLASRPDINPYYRQGIEIDLSLHKTA